SLAVWATVGIAMVASTCAAQRVARARPPLAAAVAVVAVAALLVPPVATTWPVRWQRVQGSFLRPLLQACDAVPADGAVIVVGGAASLTLPQTLRSWCGVPAAGQGSVSIEDLPDVAARVRANGYRLHLVAADLDHLAGYRQPGGPEPTSTVAVEPTRQAEVTLDRAPSAYAKPEDTLQLPTPFALHVLPVDAG
ncbi:MAG TPA: hypothetical protein VHK88_01590, partial [Aquihabitans sp.]|nr:hypothetical protein [Aquihabitans sp.]